MFMVPVPKKFSYWNNVSENGFAYYINQINNLKIWLILPVVIRSSQRLSHACLSSSICTVKLRMAHYNSYSLFDIFSTWITVVILELIHAFFGSIYWSLPTRFTVFW